MDKLLQLLAWIAIELKLSKDIDLTEEGGEPASAGSLVAMLIVIAGFLILAFA